VNDLSSYNKTYCMKLVMIIRFPICELVIINSKLVEPVGGEKIFLFTRAG
jgi:hypothetical protein